jgi:hypothetical protein
MTNFKNKKYNKSDFNWKQVKYSIYRNNINKTIVKRTELYINKGEN